MSLVKPAYLRFGIDFKSEDAPQTKMLRVDLTKQSCTHGYRDCVKEAQDLYNEWMTSSDPNQFTR